MLLRHDISVLLVQWNVLMVAALLAALPTLLVYIFLGHFFLRGLMAGALKGEPLNSSDGCCHKPVA